MSRSGRSNTGSHTTRIADSNSSTRVSLGTQPASRCACRHAPVVAAEEGEEVLRQVVLVDCGEPAHDPEVERDVAPLRVHQDIARVHVGVEEAVAEHLGEEDLHPLRASCLKSTPCARSASIWLIGVPVMRSMTITWLEQ